MSMGGKQFAYCRKLSESKSFSDVLGPINRYLMSSVGRPWDDVYSELKQGLGRFSWPLQHILRVHVDVAVRTYRGVDGNVWHMDKRGPEIVKGSYRDEFYVHPETATLQVMKASEYRNFSSYIKNKYKVVPEIPVDLKDGRYACLIDDQWYIGSYEFTADPEIPAHFEMLGGVMYLRPKNYDQVAAVWPDYRLGQGRMMFTKLKQANGKEIKLIRKLR